MKEGQLLELNCGNSYFSPQSGQRNCAVGISECAKLLKHQVMFLILIQNITGKNVITNYFFFAHCYSHNFG